MKVLRRWQGGNKKLVVIVSLPNGIQRKMFNSHWIVWKVTKLDLTNYPKAVVHHVDEDKLYDSPNNLVVCQDENYHRFLHRRLRAIKATGNPNARKCNICKLWGVPGEKDFVHYKSNATRHKDCHNKKMAEFRLNQLFT